MHVPTNYEKSRNFHRTAEVFFADQKSSLCGWTVRLTQTDCTIMPIPAAVGKHAPTLGMQADVVIYIGTTLLQAKARVSSYQNGIMSLTLRQPAMKIERRSTNRKRCALSAVLHNAENAQQKMAVTTVDLSVSGARLILRGSLPGKRLNLTFTIPPEEEKVDWMEAVEERIRTTLGDAYTPQPRLKEERFYSALTITCPVQVVHQSTEVGGKMIAGVAFGRLAPMEQMRIAHYTGFSAGVTSDTEENV